MKKKVFLKEAIKEWEEKQRNTIIPITSEDIAKVVENTTGIKVRELENDQLQRLEKMEETLQEKIIGQDNAISSVCQVYKRARIGIKYNQRPVGSFIFLGPTGVGKSELSKQLAAFVFGSKESIIKFDMSEFMEKHTVSRLIGSPPGYVGHYDGGQLTEKVKQKPYSIILFDEIEKSPSGCF